MMAELELVALCVTLCAHWQNPSQWSFLLDSGQAHLPPRYPGVTRSHKPVRASFKVPYSNKSAITSSNYWVYRVW